jgi:hypothetical protein
MLKELTDDKGNVFYQLDFLENDRILYSNWIGSYLSVEQVKSGANTTLQKIRELGVDLVLNDNRQLDGSWDSANEWIAKEWMPNALRSGLRKLAHIVAQDIFARLSAEFMQDNSRKVVKGELEVRLFESKEEALKWLSEE